MMDKVIDFEQKKIDKEQPTIVDIIEGFTSHNCDTNRPYLEQQALRAQIEIKGLTSRDICDCMVLGILDCVEDHKFPCIYVSEKGNLFHDWDSLIASDEGYANHYLDAEKITYNDLYGFDLDKIDPLAAVQNMACYLERRMGIYPALQDE